MNSQIYIKFLVVIAASILFSCNQKSEGMNAEVSDAKEVSDVIDAKELNIVTNESKVSWIGSKPTGKHNGYIPISKGSIAVSADKIVGGTIEMDLNNIENEDLAESPDRQAKLENHLKSADFFDVENFPTATFKIVSVEPYSGSDSVKIKKEFESEYKPASAKEHMVQSPTHKITGNLTMRGKTLSISFPAQVVFSDNQIKAKAKFNIDRTLWDLKYSNEATVVDKAQDRFIYNTVNVGFDITASADSM